MRCLIKTSIPTACALAGMGFAVGASAAGSQPAMTVPYVTRSGDTLYGVSDRYLQGPDDWHRVARLNAVRAPRALPPGKVLHLPVARLRKERLDAHVIATHGPVERAAEGDASAFAPDINS